LIFFLFGFTVAASMHLTLIAATAVGAVFALINYQMTMIRLRGAKTNTNEEEDI
jgi:PTS system mannose-specific IIC component